MADQLSGQTFIVWFRFLLRGRGNTLCNINGFFIMIRKFHHAKLPNYSKLLSGHTPPDESAFQSTALQIWYNNTDKTWVESPEPLHYHKGSDEIFVVLKGALHVEVEGQVHRIAEREFCCFPAGQWHAVVRVELPAETLMIRSPSINDKVYKDSDD